MSNNTDNIQETGSSVHSRIYVYISSMILMTIYYLYL